MVHCGACRTYCFASPLAMLLVISYNGYNMYRVSILSMFDNTVYVGVQLPQFDFLIIQMSVFHPVSKLNYPVQQSDLPGTIFSIGCGLKNYRLVFLPTKLAAS